MINKLLLRYLLPNDKAQQIKCHKTTALFKDRLVSTPSLGNICPYYF
ncbi:MAG: hypothetical protein ACI9IJ_001680 [Psychromonas sp.]|jgi:hypothetical protein